MILWDLMEFYEHIDRDKLMSRARKRTDSKSMAAIRLATQSYSHVRILSVDGAEHLMRTCQVRHCGGVHLCDNSSVYLYT